MEICCSQYRICKTTTFWEIWDPWRYILFCERYWKKSIFRRSKKALGAKRSWKEMEIQKQKINIKITPNLLSNFCHFLSDSRTTSFSPKSTDNIWFWSVVEHIHFTGNQVSFFTYFYNLAHSINNYKNRLMISILSYSIYEYGNQSLKLKGSQYLPLSLSLYVDLNNLIYYKKHFIVN